MKNIYILWASVRPCMVKDTYNHWINSATNSLDRIFLKVVTKTEEQKRELDNYQLHNCDVQVFDKHGYCPAITFLTSQLEVEDEDILILLSDDFFSPIGWDDLLYEQFEHWDGGLFLNDGYQSIDSQVGLCWTIACLTFKALKKLNKVIFHPEYTHFFSDDEAYNNAFELGILLDVRKKLPVFKHEHYRDGCRKQDENDTKNQEYWNKDKTTYERRKMIPLNERLKYSLL